MRVPIETIQYLENFFRDLTQVVLLGVHSSTFDRRE